MPIYTVRLSDGRTVKLQADREPTESEVLAQIGPAPPSAPAVSPAVSHTSSPKVELFGHDMTGVGDAAVHALPQVGGIAGEMVGGRYGKVGSVVGSAVGGAAGKGAEMLLDDQPQTFGEGAKAMGTEALIQGGSAAGGIGLGALLKGGATALYRKALQPAVSERLAPRAAETVETGLVERINPFSMRNLRRIEPALEDLKGRVAGMVGGQPTRPIASPSTLAGRTTNTIDRYLPAGADPADRAAAMRVPQQFVEDRTLSTPAQFYPPTPAVSHEVPFGSGTDLVASRRAAGASAGQKSFGVTRGAETDARKELYHVMGEELGQTYPQTVPLMNRERRLIDLKDASFSAHERAANRGLGFAGKHGLAGAAAIYGGANQNGSAMDAIRNGLVAEMAMSPRVWSRSAILMRQLSEHPHLLSQLPRGFVKLLQEEGVGSGDPGEEEDLYPSPVVAANRR